MSVLLTSQFESVLRLWLQGFPKSLLMGGSGKRFDDDRRDAGHLKTVAEPCSTWSESVFQAQAFFNPDGHLARLGAVLVFFFTDRK